MEKNPRLRFLVVGIIFVGALYRYWPIATALGSCGIGYESLQIACSLAHNSSFSDPFSVLPTGPSAHLAPLFPWLVSVLIRRFGEGSTALNALQWMGTLVIAVQLSLWPLVAESLGMGFVAGAIGAAGWLFARFIVLPMWEAAYVALLILILVICMQRILSRQVSTLFVLLAGALWGITFLLSPVPLLPFIALALWIACFGRIRRIQKLALIIVPFVVISPWLVRNYQVFHHFFFIRDNLGTELVNSNNPCATYSFNLNRAAKCYNHPNESLEEAQKVRSLGEYQYNDAKFQEAMAWIKNNPGRFADLTKQRFLAFWFYIPGGNYFAGRHIPAGILIVWLIAPLSIGGIWLLYKNDRNAAGLCLVWLVLFPPIYYFVAFVPRYRYPILWASFMPASFFLTEVFGRVWRGLRKSNATAAARDESPKPQAEF